MQISVKENEKNNDVIVELSSQEKVDKYGYGVLTNNKFENLANVYERQMNESRILLYKGLPAKTVNSWMQDKINEFALLTMLRSITEMTTSLSAFSLYLEGLLMDPAYVFVTDKGTAQFIYIPIEGIRLGKKAVDLIHDILEGVVPKTEVCAEYIQTLEALYENENLRIDQIKQMIDKLSGREEKKASKPKEVVEAGLQQSDSAEKIDHSDFVMKNHKENKEQKKNDKEKLQVGSVDQHGKVSSSSPKGNSAKAEPNVAPGGFLVPGMESYSPGNEKKKKEKKSDARSKSTEGNTPKKKLNLTEMLIAWIKKRKAKSKIDKSSDLPKKGNKDKQNKEKEQKQKQSAENSLATPPADYRKKPSPQKSVDTKKNNPSAPVLTSTSKKNNEQKAVAKSVAPMRQSIQPEESEKKELLKNPEKEKPIERLETLSDTSSSPQKVASEKKNISCQSSDVAVHTNERNGNIQIIVNLPANQVQANVTEYIDKLRPKLIRQSTEETIVVDCATFKIGKEKGYVNYFIQDNPHISRAHANLISKEGKYFIVDTNSTNHTFVNGKMCESNVETELNNGDVIRLANEDFTFICQG